MSIMTPFVTFTLNDVVNCVQHLNIPVKCILLKETRINPLNVIFETHHCYVLMNTKSREWLNINLTFFFTF
jgi:hypothetical protein